MQVRIHVGNAGRLPGMSSPIWVVVEIKTLPQKEGMLDGTRNPFSICLGTCREANDISGGRRRK